jgi:hypothetical protein
MGDQVRHAEGDHASFSGTGACEDQQWSLQSGDGLALRRIQTCKTEHGSGEG